MVVSTCLVGFVADDGKRFPFSITRMALPHPSLESRVTSREVLEMVKLTSYPTGYPTGYPLNKEGKGPSKGHETFLLRTDSSQRAHTRVTLFMFVSSNAVCSSFSRYI